MPDRLERDLAALAAEIEFPPTPDIAPAVLARISERPRKRRLAPARRTLVLAAALLALLAAAAGAVPAVRHAVKDLLGLNGATIERVPRLPASPGGLDLGRRVTLGDATRGLRFRPRVPHDPRLGRPDAVNLRGRPPLAQLTLLYRPGSGLPEGVVSGVGLLLTEFRGDFEPELVSKLVRTSTSIRRVRIGRDRGLWIGGPHSFGYRDGSGEVRLSERRLADKTLVWQHGRLLLRLESSLSLRRTLEIAAAMR